MATKQWLKYGIDMRYFVKSHFNGWREVGCENYKAFIKNIMNHATGIPCDKKQEYINKVTKVIQTGINTERKQK